MSTEPERHIEKELRSFANQRRGKAGAPFKMHQATRNLLQSQVARRTLNSPRERNFLSQIFVGLWPRIAFGVSAFAVLMFSTWMFFQTQKKPDEPLKSAAHVADGQPVDAIAANTALTTSVVTVAQVDERTDAATPGPNDTTQNGKDAQGKQFASRSISRDIASEKNRADSVGQKFALQSAPAAAPQLADGKKAESANLPSAEVDLKPSLAQTEAAPKRPLTDKLATPIQSPASPTAARPAPPAAQAFYDAKNVDRSSLVGLSGAGVTQRFAQMAPPATSNNASRSAIANTVLSSFQMEQAGNRVRVIDKDGSTYTGYLQTTSVGSAPPPAAADKEFARSLETKTKTLISRPSEKLEARSGNETSRDYFFRVAGTNRTLNQNVIFTGHLLTNTPYTDLSKTNDNRAERGQLKPPASNPALPLLLKSRISGTALIGENNAVEIQALPVAPESGRFPNDNFDAGFPNSFQRNKG